MSLVEWLPAAVVLTFLAYRRRSIKPLLAMMWLYAATTMSLIMLSMPHMVEGIPLRLAWNWQGKLLDFVWPWIVVYGFSGLTPRKVGLCLPKYYSYFGYAVLSGVIFAFFSFVLSFILGTMTQDSYNFETVLFQATMPGLAEEITSRGIFLAILNHYLGKSWRMGMTSFGWGIVLVTVSFIIGHLYHYNSAKHQLVWNISSYIDYCNIAIVLVAGILLGALRERSKSIWLGVLCHNIMNSLGYILEKLFFSSSV